MTTCRIQSKGILASLGCLWLLASLVAWGAPPVIVKRPETVRFQPGTTVEMSVTAESSLPISYQWFRNKAPIAGATEAALVIASGRVEHMGDYSVEVSNADGTVSSLPDDDARALMVGAFVVEAEDFNFDGGKTSVGASVMPLNSDLYQGRDGLPGIDFHLVNQTSPNALDFGNAYRNGWGLFGVALGLPPTAPEPLGNVDIIEETGPHNLERPDYSMTRNYKLGWNDPGEWYQYTRDFPPGEYAAVAIVARDGLKTNRFAATLEIVTGDPSSISAAATVVGEIAGTGTGGWTSYDYMPFQVPGATEPATLTIWKGDTIRIRVTEGDCDLDALLFYKVAECTTCCTWCDPLLSGSQFRQIKVDLATGTVTAHLLPHRSSGFFRLNGVTKIESVRLEGDILVVRFR